MDMKKIPFAIITALVSTSMLGNEAQAQEKQASDYHHAMTLYQNRMYGESSVLFADYSDKTGDLNALGYHILCEIKLGRRGYEEKMERFIKDYPYSGFVPQMCYAHALNLFDKEDYEGAAVEFMKVRQNEIGKADRSEYLYKRSYSLLKTGDLDGASYGFLKIEGMKYNNYTSPSRFALAYIDYENKKFTSAIRRFEQSAKDLRFKDISEYYIMECRFMNKDYAYVTSKAAEYYENVPEERKPHLARIISESYLVLGDAENAKKYFDRASIGNSESREDYFYAGSVLYNVQDYKGAVDNFSKMPERTDSLGQIANYQMAFSYINLKNKVAAMSAFRDASNVSYNPDIQEDAFFNYAKLSFDLNNDPTVFDAYLKKYSDKKRGNSIYAYQALAALQSHDYAGAVAAYDKIDELDDDMKANYTKANYLRANQLIKGGSYRNAIQHLRVAEYYSDKRSYLNHLSKYWLAQSYYKDEQYSKAIPLFTDLYNISAMDGRQEGRLIPYDLAYCYFRTNDFEQASKWFDKYLSQGSRAEYKKDALLRKADVEFMSADYVSAIKAYEQVLSEFNEPSDLYPAYQIGIAYGLIGNTPAKIKALSPAEKVSPKTFLYSESVYELGRAYLSDGQIDRASSCFDELIRNSVDTIFIAKSYLGLGMVARDRKDFDTALSKYKIVVSDFAGTEYASDAMAAIESIYQIKQEPEQYLAYIESLGNNPSKKDIDKEEMLFNGAEQIYLAGNYAKALVSLQDYEQRYPHGKHFLEAFFYLAESYKYTGNKDKAADYYAKVMGSVSDFSEISALNYAQLCEAMEKYQEAFDGYSKLKDIARLDANKHIAEVGMMTSAFKSKNYEESVNYAGNVLADKASTAAEKLTANSIKAKSLLYSGNREAALKVLAALAKDPKSAEGAEAAYMLVQNSYDKGDFKDVEKKVFALSDSGSSQTYWLAKSFLLLGDSYVETGEYEQAKATFESIRDGYKAADDDILENVNMRLQKLQELSK